MITLRRWFFLYGILPFFAGVAVFAIAGILFIAQMTKTYLESAERNVDELTKILSIANKQKSQEIHDLAFNSFLLSHSVKSILYCAKSEILFEWPIGHSNCDKNKSGLLVITKVMPHSGAAKITAEFSPAPLYKLLIPLLIAYIAFITLAGIIGTKLRRRLSNDLLSIVTADVDNHNDSRIKEVKELFEKVKAIQKDQLEAEKIRSLQSVYNQVAHDIRSPLSALSMVSSTLNDIPKEKKNLIIHAVQRINDIANDLLSKSKHASAPISTTLNTELVNNRVKFTDEPQAEPTSIWHLVDSLISEKRIQYGSQPNINFELNGTDDANLLVNIIPREFSRAISNLINNSIESFSNSAGTVTVFVRKYGDQVSIVVQDDGKGIPPEVLTKLCEKGVSFGKDGTQSGSGLGLWHAKKTIESFKGQFNIISKVDVGTQIIMTLPISSSPSPIKPTDS